MAIELDIKSVQPRDRADFKATEIAKLDHTGTFTQGDLRLEIQSLKKIEKGVEVLVRAWKNGAPLGFGKDGSVEIERVRIHNPPALVDDPAGTIIREWTDEVAGEVKQRTLREDPVQALREVLARVVKSSGKDGKDIVKGKIGRTTSTFSPDASVESTSVDGSVLKGPVSTWASARDSADGDTVSTADATRNIFAGDLDGTDFRVSRVFLLFDTSALLDTDTIDSATLRVTQYTSAGEGNRNIALIQTSPASNTDLVVGDFDALTVNSPDEGATRVTMDTANADHTFTLNATGLTWIDATGITKLGLRGEKDVDDVEPEERNYSGMHFADETGTSKDPLLTVEHTGATFTPKVMVF